MLTFGLNTAILANESFEAVIDYVAKIGLSCVEVCAWPKGKAVRRYAGVTHIDVLGERDKLSYYKDYAQEKGVDISALAYYPNPLDADLEQRQFAVEHIYRLLEAADEMGVSTLTTFIGKDKTQTVEANLELFEEVWAPIVKAAEVAKVKIAIENCPMYYSVDEWPGGTNLASTPAIWTEMFKRIPSDYLGLNYDPSHPYLLFSDYIAPIYDFREKIFHIHFKDIRIHQDKLNYYGAFSYPSLWHSPKLPGLGGIDFAAFCSALNDIHYAGYACIEVEDRAFEASVSDVKRGIEQSVRYLRNFLD